MVLTSKVWTPTPDRCKQNLAARPRRKGRARWLFLNETAIDKHETAFPTLHGGWVDLAIGSAHERRSFAGGAGETVGQGRSDDGARIQETRNNLGVEERDHLATPDTFPAALLDEVLALELTQPPSPEVVNSPLLAAASRTAHRECRWYAPGGFLPGLRSEPPSQLRRLFPWRGV